MDDGLLPNDESTRPLGPRPARSGAPRREPAPEQGRTSGSIPRPVRQRPALDDLSQPFPSVDDSGFDVADDRPLLLPPIIPAEREQSASRPIPRPATGRVAEGMVGRTIRTGGRPSASTVPRPRVRRVTRVVRQIDAWSVFKVALVFSFFLYITLLTSGVLLWQVAQNTGTVDNVERFFENFGWTSFELKGGEIYHNAWIAGLFGVVGLTGLAVLVATLFNLITDLVGGIRVSVLEEEVHAREILRSGG